MVLDIPIVSKRQVDLETYYVVRGIKDAGKCKKVVAEKEFIDSPTVYEIARFLMENECDFASVTKNYRIAGNSEGCESFPPPYM